MDGIIVDSERSWEAARLAVVAEFGGTYHPAMVRDLMGMTPPEWSRYLHDRVGIPLSPARIEVEIVRRMVAALKRDRPFFPGAIEAVRAVGARWPTGLASSSGRDIIDLVVGLADLREVFTVTVSAAETGRGKPAPDVYLRAATLLGVDPRACVAIEDSASGIRSARDAGMRTIALLDPAYGIDRAERSTADATIASLVELTPELVRAAARR